MARFRSVMDVEAMPACGQHYFFLRDAGAASSLNSNNLRKGWFWQLGCEMESRGDRHFAIGSTKPVAKYPAPRENFMSFILVPMRKWNAWYRVLRHGKGLSFFASVRYGLWLARG
jgi:hypothetical protein